jgi:hypothetical protein
MGLIAIGADLVTVITSAPREGIRSQFKEFGPGRRLFTAARRSHRTEVAT